MFFQRIRAYDVFGVVRIVHNPVSQKEEETQNQASKQNKEIQRINLTICNIKP